MVEEQELVRRVLAGSPDAEREFFERYRPRLLRASRFFLGGQDSDAEDIVQETYIIAFRRLGEYVFRAPIYAWLRQICLRLCYARLRARRRVLVSREGDLEVYLHAAALRRVSDGEADVQRLARLALLETLKGGLSPDGRRIIELRDVQGLRYAAIGAALGIPMGTVMSRLARARTRLRAALLAGRPGEGAGPAAAEFAR